MGNNKSLDSFSSVLVYPMLLVVSSILSTTLDWIPNSFSITCFRTVTVLLDRHVERVSRRMVRYLALSNFLIYITLTVLIALIVRTNTKVNSLCSAMWLTLQWYWLKTSRYLTPFWSFYTESTYHFPLVLESSHAVAVCFFFW